MKTNHTKHYTWAALAMVSLVLCSWKSESSTLPVRSFSLKQVTDTVITRKKDKKEYRVADLDQAMKELDEAMRDMDKTTKIDFTKMDKEIKQALEEIKKVDFEKISREVASELKKIDWEKTRTEVNKALQEAHTQLKEVDVKHIQEEVARAQENIKSQKTLAHIDMQKIKENVEKSLSNARNGIEKAKKEIGLLKEFTGALEKDGLINRKKGYRIEIKNGEMFINGNKQSKEINDKYRKYFKDEDYTISSDGDEVGTL